MNGFKDFLALSEDLANPALINAPQTPTQKAAALGTLNQMSQTGQGGIKMRSLLPGARKAVTQGRAKDASQAVDIAKAVAGVQGAPI